MAELVSKQTKSAQSSSARGRNFSVVTNSKGKTIDLRPQNSRNLCNLFWTLTPAFFFYPLRRYLLWCSWIMIWVTLAQAFQPAEAFLPSFLSPRFVGLIVSMLAIKWAAKLVMPWFGILFKWLVIGKYRAGK